MAMDLPFCSLSEVARHNPILQKQRIRAPRIFPWQQGFQAPTLLVGLRLSDLRAIKRKNGHHHARDEEGELLSSSDEPG
jgi:hypothetical protein